MLFCQCTFEATTHNSEMQQLDTEADKVGTGGPVEPASESQCKGDSHSEATNSSSASSLASTSTSASDNKSASQAPGVVKDAENEPVLKPFEDRVDAAAGS